MYVYTIIELQQKSTVLIENHLISYFQSKWSLESLLGNRKPEVVLIREIRKKWSSIIWLMLPAKEVYLYEKSI